VYGLGAILTSPLAGRLSDHFGPLRIMQLSLLLSGALLLFFPLVTNYFALCGLAFLWAMLSEAFRPASMSIISDWVLPEQRKAAFALNRLAINLGMSIGPAAAGFIATVSFTAIFVIDGATSILAGLMLLFSALRSRVPHVAAAHVHDPATPRARTRDVFTDRRFLYFMLALLPVTVVFFQHNSTLPLFLVRDLHLPESSYGLLFAVNTVMIILLEVPLNASMAHWTHRHALALSCVFWSVGFGMLMFVNSFAGAALSVAIWTFGEMILFPGSANYVSEIAPSARRGTYLGVYQMSYSLAFILAPWLGTQMLEHFDAKRLWAATFVLGGLSAMMMWRIGEHTIAKHVESS
jgi:MFS family permease